MPPRTRMAAMMFRSLLEVDRQNREVAQRKLGVKDYQCVLQEIAIVHGLATSSTVENGVESLGQFRNSYSTAAFHAGKVETNGKLLRRWLVLGEYVEDIDRSPISLEAEFDLRLKSVLANIPDDISCGKFVFKDSKVLRALACGWKSSAIEDALKGGFRK